jgi:hypothetical protein
MATASMRSPLHAVVQQMIDKVREVEAAAAAELSEGALGAADHQAIQAVVDRTAFLERWIASTTR